MQRDGVDAEVLYPNYAMRLFVIPDPALSGSLLAYNDWLADFCSAHPAELLGIAVIPAAEWMGPSSRGAAGQGPRNGWGVLPQDTPDGSRYSHPQWVPLWATLAEMALPVSLHIIASGHASANWAKDETGEENAGVAYAVLPVRMARAFGTFILEGVFDRHPGLRIVSAENELSGGRLPAPPRLGLPPSDHGRRPDDHVQATAQRVLARELRHDLHRRPRRRMPSRSSMKVMAQFSRQYSVGSRLHVIIRSPAIV